MKRIMIIMRRDYKEMRSNTAFRILIYVTVFITVGASAGISAVLRLQQWYGTPETVPVLNFICGLVIYFIPLVVLLAFNWAFASLPVVSEKVNGNIECLLATPIGTKELWIGKILAIIIPSSISSTIAVLFFVIVLNLAVIYPGWNMIVLPWPAMVTGLVVNQLLFSGMLSFILLFSLANNPDIAIAPTLLLGFGLMIGIPVGIMTGTIDMSSWSFSFWYLSGSVLIWLVVLYMTRILTKQNIVLSTKGS